MHGEQFYESPDFAAILTFIDAIFSELNMGLFIYHVEDPTKIDSARLIYANKEASRCTGTDLRRMLGKQIFNAFPYLAETKARMFEIFRSGAVPTKYLKPVAVNFFEPDDDMSDCHGHNAWALYN